MKTVRALAGVFVLSTAVACTAPTPLPTAANASASATTNVRSATLSGSTTSATELATSAPALIPWNPAEVRSVTDLVSAAEPPYGSANFALCHDNAFRLLPNSSQTTSTDGGFMTTTFVLQFTGSAPCSINPGYYGVNMTTADGTAVPIDIRPVGPARTPLDVRPDQFVFSSVWWTVKPGLPHPADLTVTLGGTSTSRPISLPVADASIPPQSSTPDPDNASQSTAYALLTAAADPAALASLTATVTAPPTVSVPSTLVYSVTLTNHTDTSVPLTSCPEFGEQFSVVPDKIEITIGARGLLNCSQLPPALPENSSVTMLMQLDTVGEVTGPGRLTWQLLDHGNQATAVDTALTVQ